MARVSVPLWLTDLSVQLPVIALVSFYLTNKLIGRRLLLRWPVTAFLPRLLSGLMRYYDRFLDPIPRQRADSYALLTRPPLGRKFDRARLAYLKHAASVYPEPGSNSQLK